MKFTIDLGMALQGVGLTLTAIMSFLSWLQARRNHTLGLVTHDLVNGITEGNRKVSYDRGVADERAGIAAAPPPETESDKDKQEIPK